MGYIVDYEPYVDYVTFRGDMLYDLAYKDLIFAHERRGGLVVAHSAGRTRRATGVSAARRRTPCSLLEHLLGLLLNDQLV